MVSTRFVTGFSGLAPSEARGAGMVCPNLPRARPHALLLALPSKSSRKCTIEIDVNSAVLLAPRIERRITDAVACDTVRRASYQPDAASKC